MRSCGLFCLRATKYFNHTKSSPLVFADDLGLRDPKKFCRREYKLWGLTLYLLQTECIFGRSGFHQIWRVGEKWREWSMSKSESWKKKHFYLPFGIFSSSLGASSSSCHHPEASKESHISSVRAKNFILDTSTSKGAECSEKKRRGKCKHESWLSCLDSYSSQQM